MKADEENPSYLLCSGSGYFSSWPEVSLVGFESVSGPRLGFYDKNGDLGRNKRPTWFVIFFRYLWEFAEPLTYFSGSR
jgi:hypothetical protein